MIKFADNSSRQQVYDMWQTVFGDPDNYMELYFRTKYKNENTLIYYEYDKAVASLQMLSFDFTFYDTEIPIYYLSGVCTLPEARKKGYMDQLLQKSFEVAKEREITLMMLVPQEEWLLKFYDKYGFAQTFSAGVDPLVSLKDLNDKYPNNLLSAYKEFDSHFRNQDMTIQKTFDDFKAIIEENAMWDFTEKKSLIGMARIIDAKQLLSIFSKSIGNNVFSVKIVDELMESNNKQYTVREGKVEESKSIILPHFELDIRKLVQLLLGYNLSEMDKDLQAIFPKKNPQIHFMME